MNNAGIAVIKPYLECTDEEFDRQLSVNLRGTHLFLSRVLPGMVDASAAPSSTSRPWRPSTSPPPCRYAASKAGIIALTQEVAFEWPATASGELRRAGLIAVPPSATKSPTSRASRNGRAGHDADDDRPRLRSPEDIANAVAFLLSDQARFIIGQTLKVAGGTDLGQHAVSRRTAELTPTP